MRVGQFSFLPIGSHSHCDLLAVEFRVDGHDIVVDPGTYVYGALAGWRQHLRSTASHPTLMLEGTDQAEYWGPFLWGTDASAEIVACDRDPVGHITGWRSEHDGYRHLTPTARVSRGLELRPDSLTITDLVLRSAASNVRLAFPLSPLCDVVPGRSPSEFHGEVGPIRLRFDLPETLSWRLVPRGEIPAGMMSPSFGRLEAAHSLIGSGSVSADHPLISVISFSRVPADLDGHGVLSEHQG